MLMEFHRVSIRQKQNNRLTNSGEITINISHHVNRYRKHDRKQEL